MNLNEPFRDGALAASLLKIISAESEGREYKIMEVCGTHTMAISRSGLRSILPENVKLVSGPGCPVCVTSQGEIDAFFKIVEKGAVAVTFGDMLRIPSSKGATLSDTRAAGADVRIIYSPLDTLKFAKAEPEKEFVFLGVGFETTAPTIAYLILLAAEAGLKNVSVLSLCKTMPKAFELLLSDEELLIGGFLCPGHVTAVTGISLYKPVVAAKKAAVIAGFEPVEMLDAILEVVRQINSGKFTISNKYKRVVNDDGNAAARAMIDKVFTPSDLVWRGLGKLTDSGLKIRDEFAQYDALKKYDITIDDVTEIKGCKCGAVLTGKMLPSGCPLFGKRCTPESPVGPCMVSSEGTCAAYYKY